MQLHKTVRGGQTFYYYNRREFWHLYRDIFLFHQYAFSTTHPHPVIVDAGAHIGMSVLYFARRFPQAHIIAIEPSPKSLGLLRMNTRALGEIVTLVEAALMPEAGQVDLFVERDAHNPWSWGDAVVKNAWYSPEKFKAVPVSAVPLSTILPPQVDLLKLDIEGMELAVLEEAGDALAGVQEIYLEFHGSSSNVRNNLDRLLKLLKEKGFYYTILQYGPFISPTYILRRDPYWLLIHARRFPFAHPYRDYLAAVLR